MSLQSVCKAQNFFRLRRAAAFAFAMCVDCGRGCEPRSSDTQGCRTAHYVAAVRQLGCKLEAAGWQRLSSQRCLSVGFLTVALLRARRG